MKRPAISTTPDTLRKNTLSAIRHQCLNDGYVPKNIREKDCGDGHRKMLFDNPIGETFQIPMVLSNADDWDDVEIPQSDLTEEKLQAYKEWQALSLVLDEGSDEQKMARMGEFSRLRAIFS